MISYFNQATTSPYLQTKALTTNLITSLNWTKKLLSVQSKIIISKMYWSILYDLLKKQQASEDVLKEIEKIVSKKAFASSTNYEHESFINSWLIDSNKF